MSEGLSNQEYYLDKSTLQHVDKDILVQLELLCKTLFMIQTTIKNRGDKNEFL